MLFGGLLISLFVGLSIASTKDSAVEKFVNVKGKLTCPENEKAQNLQVKLLLETEGPEPDTLLAETTTDNDGEFSMKASKSVPGKLLSLIQLTHSCVPEAPDDCTPVTWKIHVPQCHVSANNSHVFDIGTWDLKTHTADVVKDCIVESLGMTCRSTLTVKCHDHSTSGHESHGHAHEAQKADGQAAEHAHGHDHHH